MAAPTDHPSSLDLPGSTNWVQAAGKRLAGVWHSPNIPPTAARLFANARVSIFRQAEHLLDGLETQGASVVSELAGQASRLAERMTAHLSVASRHDLIELRQLLTQVERKLDRLASERQNRPPHPPAAEPDEVPPSLPPWPAD